MLSQEFFPTYIIIHGSNRRGYLIIPRRCLFLWSWSLRWTMAALKLHKGDRGTDVSGPYLFREVVLAKPVPSSIRT